MLYGLPLGPAIVRSRSYSTLGRPRTTRRRSPARRRNSARGRDPSRRRRRSRGRRGNRRGWPRLQGTSGRPCALRGGRLGTPAVGIPVVGSLVRTAPGERLHPAQEFEHSSARVIAVVERIPLEQLIHVALGKLLGRQEHRDEVADEVFEHLVVSIGPIDISVYAKVPFDGVPATQILPALLCALRGHQHKATN